MDGGSSNIDALGQEIQDLIRTFDWTRPGIDESMAEDAAHAIVEDIASSAAELQENPDGTPFPQNEPIYAARKARLYGMHPPAYGFRTGQTLSLASLLGDLVISEDQVELRYGTGQAPTRSSASGYISDADKEVTDIEKMYFLTTGKDPIDPYQIGPYALDEIEAILVEGLRKHLGNGGG